MTGTVRATVTDVWLNGRVAMTPAERQRKHRAKVGARVGQGRGPAPSEPCGTLAAFRRHERAGEVPCEPCREANRVAQRGYRAARRERAS
jgi:hypothetical protein